MLVWRGKIIKKLDTKCPYGDFLCEFGCPEVEQFKLVVCGQLFVYRKENDVAIPMEFKSGERVYTPGTEDTPLCRSPKENELSGG